MITFVKHLQLINMEQLLNYIWKHKLFLLQGLQTVSGFPVEVLETGFPNPAGGPDFLHAKIKINDTVWVGNIAIQRFSSQWMEQGHHKDPRYDSVILHVSEVIDGKVERTNGEIIPQIKLEYPEMLYSRYQKLLERVQVPPCYKIIHGLPELMLHSWLSALQRERFQEKTKQVEFRLSKCNGNWEDVLFITLARNFGFGYNGDAFEKWANLISWRSVDKHRDNLFQIEAFFFGQAGLLNEIIEDEYYSKLQKEYFYLKHKFGLVTMDVSAWCFAGVRPGNFPHVRIAQLAFLYYQQRALLSQIAEAQNIKEIKDILRAGTSVYWETHYSFYRAAPHKLKIMSDSSLDLLIINTVVTFLYAYGRHRREEILYTRAESFLEELKAENNYITRMWNSVGIKVKNAADSQALIQFKKEYCDKKRCLECRIGFEYLKGRSCKS